MNKNPFSLIGKTILVTGASSGIGRAVAVECSNAGANVILTARNKERLEQTLQMMDGQGHQVVVADLSDVDAIDNLINAMPKLDGVVFCAGIVKTLVTKQSDKNDTLDIFNTNTFSVISLTQSLLVEKKLNKGSSLVFISSVSGVYCGYIGGGLYGASKGALQGFMQGLALELAPRTIRVNTINPGMVETNLLANSEISQEQIEEDKKRFPLKRYGKPEEIGYAAVYLLSDATVWMTGSSLKIDGGYTLQ